MEMTMKQTVLKECSGSDGNTTQPAKLVQPSQPTLEFELVAEETQILDGWGNQTGAFGSVELDGVQYRLDKMYRIKGTNMFVMGSSQLQ